MNQRANRSYRNSLGSYETDLRRRFLDRYFLLIDADPVCSRHPSADPVYPVQAERYQNLGAYHKIRTGVARQKQSMENLIQL